MIDDAALRALIDAEGVPIRLGIGRNPDGVVGWIKRDEFAVRGSLALADFLRGVADAVEEATG